MSYGSYTFDPVPMMNITRQWRDITEDGVSGAFSYNITLDGTLTPFPSGDGSVVSIRDLQDALISGVNNNSCNLLTVMCDSTTILSAYPKVKSISFPQSTNSWIFTSPYTVELECDGLVGVDSVDSPLLTNASESWSVELVDDHLGHSINLNDVSYKYSGYSYVNDVGPIFGRISHNLSARGKYSCGLSGVANTPWIDAKNWVIGQLGMDTGVLNYNALNINVGSMSGYNHIRTCQIDESNGSYSVTESWLLSSSGNVMEDFDISVQKSLEDPLTNVTINGRVVGLATINYGSSVGDYSVSTHKYNAAKTYWAGIQTRLLPRCQYVSQGVAQRNLHSGVVNSSVGHNITDGVITYSYTYNDRPTLCVAGALYESITINDEYPTDVFAQLIVPGRALGPILQDVGTVTQASKSVSVEVVVPITTSCNVSTMISASPKTAVDGLITEFESYLDTHGQIFKNQDNETWNPKTGRYTRTVGWVYQDC